MCTSTRLATGSQKVAAMRDPPRTNAISSWVISPRFRRSARRKTSSPGLRAHEIVSFGLEYTVDAEQLVGIVFA